MTAETKNNSMFALMVFGLVAAIIGVAVWLFIFKPTNKLPQDLAATYIPEGRPVVGLNFIDQDSRPFSEQRFKGKWTFMFFGFLNCPDVCPGTLLVMKQVWATLPEAAKQAPEPQMVFVSVDPDRDKPEQMKKYLEFYHPDFIGIRTEHKYLDVLTVQVGALYGYEDGDSENQYTVNHSAQIVLIDPQGYFRAVFTAPHTAADIVKSFSAIREYHPQ